MKTQCTRTNTFENKFSDLSALVPQTLQSSCWNTIWFTITFKYTMTLLKMLFIKMKISQLIWYNMIPDRFTKMFARKLIFRKACGPTRSKYAPLLFMWVYRERRVRFYVISAPLKSWNPSYRLSNNNFSLPCPQLRDRSMPYYTHAPKCSILRTIGS